jgi:hypothetical protein
LLLDVLCFIDWIAVLDELIVESQPLPPPFVWSVSFALSFFNCLAGMMEATFCQAALSLTVGSTIFMCALHAPSGLGVPQSNMIAEARVTSIMHVSALDGGEPHRATNILIDARHRIDLEMCRRAFAPAAA